MSTLISNSNPKTTILNAAVVRENLNYIAEFGLSTYAVEHINSCQIFHNVHINVSMITSDIILFMGF